MKNINVLKVMLSAFLLMVLSSGLTAQSPGLISYQAIIRYANGSPIVDADKVIVFKIIQASITGSVIYTETQSVKTNSYGLVNLQIGKVTSGLENINWAAGPFFLKVEVDGTLMGTTQLISVPYSLYSKVAGNGFQGSSPYYIENSNVGIGTNDPRSTLSVVGTSPSDSAIFEVKNNNGLTVFAVYNEGVRINIDETMKASKGGFAIGGFSNAKGVSRDLLRISSDSIRMYIDNTTPAKGAKGGFAIGGFDKAKAGYSRYMNISASEGNSTGYNTFIGYKSGNATYGGTHNVAIGNFSGSSLTSGNNNIFIGDSSGWATTYGFENIFIGRSSGAKMFAGYNNVYIGYQTGSEGHGQYNVFIGDQSGKYNNDGWSNVFVGNAAGKFVTNGYQNTFMGTQSGWKIGTGRENTFIGSSTGFSAVNSNGNTFIGASAGVYNVSGTDNVYVGKWAGMQATGTGNIFIGSGSGYQVTTGDNQLLIDNSSSATASTALISGNLSSDDLRFNASVSIKSAAQAGLAFYVNGTAGGTGAWTTPSDISLKKNIETISHPLEKVLALRGVSFEWIDPLKYSAGAQIGFIAQEAKNVLPEVVNKNGDYYSMQYAPVTALLVEAIKELKKENDILKEKILKIDELQAEIDALKILVSSPGNK